MPETAVVAWGLVPAVLLVALTGPALGLLVAAQIDLTRRTDEQVNGPKAVWRAVALINFFGPLAYFAVGRR